MIGLVLQSVNGRLCTDKPYAAQIDLIRASSRPLTMAFRQPLSNETLVVSKQKEEQADEIPGVKNVQRPVPKKKTADVDYSPVAPPSSLTAASESSTSDSPSAFKAPRPAEEGVPPPARQPSTSFEQTAMDPVR